MFLLMSQGAQSSKSSDADTSDADGSSESSDAGPGDADGSSTVGFPSLDDIIGLVQKSRVAPSHLADDFDPNSPTSDQQLVMSASRKDLLPILTFLASKSVVIVGTINWHSVEVLQFAIGPTWSERIPIVVCFDEKEPSKPASLPSSYSGVLTSVGQLRKNFFNLSLWVEPRIELVRWDLTRQIFKWQKAAMQSCSSVLFGTIPNRTAKKLQQKDSY